MELACSLRMFGTDRLAESCAKVRRIGFHYVELDWERVCREWPVENRRVASLKEVLSEFDLKIAGVDAGALTAERVDQLKLQNKALIRSFESLKQIGAGLVVLTGGARTLENFNCLREGLIETLVGEAQAQGLELALANRINTRIENRQDLLAFFTGEFPAAAGVCVDVHHCHLAAVNTADVIREMAGRIKLVRIADLMGTVPVLPGQGEIEIKGLIRTLRRVGYDGPIAVDHLPNRDGKLEKELEQAYAYLQGIIS